MLNIKSYPIWIFTSFLFLQLTSSMVYLGITPILPFIQQELHLSMVQIGYLAAAATLGSAICSIPSGILVDYFGVKRILFFGGIIVGLISISLYWLDEYMIILIAYLIMGIFFSTIPPAISKGILILFPSKVRGTFIGIKQGIVGVSGLLVAVWFPFMAVNYHWKMGFLIIGCVLMVISFTSFLFRDVQGEGRSMKDSSRIKLTRNEFVYVLRDKKIKTICLVIPFLFIAQFTITAYFVVDVNERFDISLIYAGYLLAFLQCGSIIGRFLFGFLVDWLFVHCRVLFLSYICIANCMIMFIFALLPFNNFIILSITALIIGMTGSGWAGLYTVIVLESVEANYVGFALGFTLTPGNISTTIGTTLFGYLYELFGGFSISWKLLGKAMFFSSVTLYRLQRKIDQDVKELNTLKMP
ncbi:MFS transporter [Bacillus sp. OK048]|uniref:MFS transporter n=1 Tax=Bacillus sp. OK048 TaxID=1882761 RepID=UPI00088ACBB1|nr:MFS transporter [Bacillus sp. OK048]SDL96116.1 Sugar phosphate permease [Bacillus sp. OK048]